MNSSSSGGALCAKDQFGTTPSAFPGDENDHAKLPNRSAILRLPDCNVLRVSLPAPLRLLAPLFVMGAVLLPLRAQPSAADALQRALHFADVYNWSDAAREFSEAEKLFLAAGDQRNALFARLGTIRSTAEQRNLPSTSAELGTELDTNPILQTDKQLRMFCLVVKGDLDEELDPGMMRKDFEQVQALAHDLGDTKWQYRSLGELGLAAFYDGDLTTARQNIGSALLAAKTNNDA